MNIVAVQEHVFQRTEFATENLTATIAATSPTVPALFHHLPDVFPDNFPASLETNAYLIRTTAMGDTIAEINPMNSTVVVSFNQKKVCLIIFQIFLWLLDLL